MKNRQKTQNANIERFLLPLIMLMLLIVGSQKAHAQSKTSSQKAPNFTLKALDGSDVSLSKLKDKPVLINFWTTWCIYCVREFPDLEEVWNEYKDKVHILAINVGETKKTIEDFLKKNPYTFPILMDAKFSASNSYNVSGIPATFIIGKDGTIVYSRAGMMNKNAMVSAIEDALKK